MMTYFIDYIKTYANTNNKGCELQTYIRQYNQTLVTDEMSMDKLKEEIADIIRNLNGKYPHTKALTLDFDEYEGKDYGQWTAWVKGDSDKIVFILSWKKVLGLYQIFKTSPVQTLGQDTIKLNK